MIRGSGSGKPKPPGTLEEQMQSAYTVRTPLLIEYLPVPYLSFSFMTFFPYLPVLRNADPWHFDVDPDPDPRIHATD